MDALPTLSVDGFTTDPAVIVVKLYEYFMASDYSQSLTFLGEIASMKYIAATAKDIDEMDRLVKDTLYKMYNRYFPVVVIDTIPKETDTLMEVSVNIIATDPTGTVHRFKDLLTKTNNNITSYYATQQQQHV